MSHSSGLGGSQVVSQASGGKVYSFNTISTASQAVAQPNPDRQKITFHNPSDVNIYIAPAVISNSSTGSQTTFAPTTAALGGCFVVFADGGTLVIEGECQIGWQAFSASGSAKPLTVMESNR